MTEHHEQSSKERLEQFRTTWDTSCVNRRDRFSYFREGVSQAFLSFSPEKPIDHEIEARVETARLPAGSVSKIDVTPHYVRRTPADLAKINGEFVSLDLHLTGGLEGSLGGKTFAETAGDVTLIDINQIKSFELNKTANYCATALLFDRAFLGKYVNFDDFMVLRQPSLGALRSCLNLLNDRYNVASKDEMIQLFDASLSLLVAELIRDKEYLEASCIKESTTRAGILQSMKDFVYKNLANPALSTEDVACQFGISIRYVQKIFAADSITFKSYVTGLRLDQVQYALFDPSFGHIATADIAFRWGFRDMTTFHRNFRHRFGDTPGQMRSLAKNGANRAWKSSVA